MNKEITISKLQSKIRDLDSYHYDIVEEIRDGKKADTKKLHLSIAKADKLREELIELGGVVPRNPNLG